MRSLKTRDARRSRQRKEARAAGVKKAPGSLETVRAFLSTVAHGRQGDELATPELMGRWLERHGLLAAGAALGEAERQRARDLRRGLRCLILAGSGGEADAGAIDRLAAAAAGGRLAVRFEDGVPIGFDPASSSVADALAALAAIVFAARLDGTWPRLKICPGNDCRRAFYDVSKSLTGRWCSPRCGERTRAADYRRRGLR